MGAENGENKLIEIRETSAQKKNEFSLIELGRCRVARWFVFEPKIQILYTFPRFGILYQEKSGNPGQVPSPKSR
jgi:hypothetical protein